MGYDLTLSQLISRHCCRLLDRMGLGADSGCRVLVTGKDGCKELVTGKDGCREVVRTVADIAGWMKGHNTKEKGLSQLLDDDTDEGILA